MQQYCIKVVLVTHYSPYLGLPGARLTVSRGWGCLSGCPGEVAALISGRSRQDAQASEFCCPPLKAEGKEGPRCAPSQGQQATQCGPRVGGARWLCDSPERREGKQRSVSLEAAESDGLGPSFPPPLLPTYLFLDQAPLFPQLYTSLLESYRGVEIWTSLSPKWFTHNQRGSFLVGNPGQRYVDGVNNCGITGK